MALEAIQTVTQAEAKAKADWEAAAAQVKQRLSDAQREAKQTVEAARQKANEEARKMMAEAAADPAGTGTGRGGLRGTEAKCPGAA